MGTRVRNCAAPRALPSGERRAAGAACHSPNHSANVGTSVTPAQAIAISGTAAIAPDPLAEAHVEVEQRPLAEPFQQPAVAGFGRAVPDGAVVERGRVGAERAAAPRR